MQLIFISGSLRRSSLQVAGLTGFCNTFTQTFVPFSNIDNSLNETKGKLESMFGDWEPITLPYKANHDCFINIIFSSTSYGLVYLDSALFGNEIYRFVSPTNGGVTSYIIPVKKGDTLTQRTVSGTVAAPGYKVMKLFS